MKITIMHDVTFDTNEGISGMLDKARDAFPEATNICVESEDGTSETILRKKND